MHGQCSKSFEKGYKIHKVQMLSSDKTSVEWSDAGNVVLEVVRLCTCYSNMTCCCGKNEYGIWYI